MRIHQCPRCELRFRDEPELKAHLVDDHHVETGSLEPWLRGLPTGIHPHRPPPDPTHASRRSRADA